MKTNTLLTLSLITLGSLFATSAQAGWSVGVSIGAPAYYPAPPVVYYPPPVVYCPPPAVVCYPPRPVYVPKCNPWGRYDYDRYGRHDWRRADYDDRRNDWHDSRGYERNARDNRSGWHR